MTTIEEQLKSYVEGQYENAKRCSFKSESLVEYDLPVLIVDDMKYEVSCRFYKHQIRPDGIPLFKITVLIQIFKDGKYHFHFPHYQKNYMTVETIELETITGLLNQARAMVNNLRYDKLYNKLIVDDEVYAKSKLDSNMVEFMTMGSDRVKVNYDECCVCNEFTYAKTQCCKGTLCVPCLLKIKGVEDEDECITIPCPLCREDLKDYEH
jgi:hypothetical protein